MKKLFFIIFLAIGFNLFSTDYLIRCDRKDKKDLSYLLKKKFKVVDETTYSLFLVLDLEEKNKIEKEYLCEILDQDPENFEYYRIGLREDSDVEKIKIIGQELYKEENWILIRIYPGANIEELKEAKVFVGKINLKGFRPPKEEIKEEEKLNLFFAPNPIVQKIVNSVSTTDIDNFWNTLVTNSPYGTRYSTSTGCQNAATYCYNQFNSFGLQAQYQNHTSGHAPNVIGIHQGGVTPNNIYIVEGHLDDMPSSGSAPGADDNASGSVHVLQAAKVLSCWGFKNTLKFLLVTGEEFGLYGSNYYASQASSSGENILGVINMDMPGWEGNGSPNPENLDLNYNAASEDLGLFYAQIPSVYGTGLVVDAFLCPSLNASDHYPFWQNGYKAVCGITDNEGYCGHTGSYPYYHTSNDTIWNCGNQSNNHSFFYATVKTTVAAMAELGKPFKIAFNKNSYGCTGQVQVILADRNLNTNPSTQQSYVVNIWSNVETTPENLTLYEDGVNNIYFKGTINLTQNPPANGDGAISVSNNSTIYTTYTDALDCNGQTNVQYNINVSACTPPVISNVQVINITHNSAVITWQTNVPATSRVTYGTTTPPSLFQEDLNYVTNHSITLNGLNLCTEYYFSVTSVDEGGNSATDNNSGNWYQFTTLGAIYAFGPDNVEGGVGNWVTSGEFHRDTCKAHSGSYAWKAGSTTCPGTYSNSTTSRLTLNQDINLGSAGHGYHLKFWEYYDTESGYDFCRPQISTDGGSSWITLGTQYSGQSGGWIQKTYDLSSYSGNIRIRFEFYADSLYNYEGWYIDDIEISKGAVCTPDLKYNSSSFTDTCNGTGSGNNNGIIDAGENISLNIVLKNNGMQTATGVSATISTSTSGITITDNSSAFPNISGQGGTGSSIDGFSFKVNSSVSCGTVINFNINITSNEGSWSDSFSLTVGQLSGGTPINLWSESFDGTTFPPSGWNQVDVSGTTGNWARSTGTVHPTGGGTHSGAGLAYFNSYTATSGNSTRLYRTSSTAIPSGAASASFVFWMYHDTGYSGNNDRIQIQVSLNGTSWTDVGSAIPRYDGSTGWKEHTVNLLSYAGQSVYIGILGISAYGNDCHIDDVKLTYTMPVTCQMNGCTPTVTPPKPVPDGTTGAPLRITKTDLSGTTLNLDWDNQCDTNANILYGNLSTISSYTLSGSVCSITDNFSWNLGTTTNIWFILVSDNGSGTESSWGMATSGQRNGTNPSNQCGNSSRNNTGTCP